MNYQSIIDFWFSDRVRSKWWEKDESFDQEICQKFSKIYQQAVAGQLQHWRQSPAGRLAEIIVLDQFPRNMFRDQSACFANDALARIATYEAIRLGADLALSPEQRAFLYMPLMHSELSEDHDQAVRLYAAQPELASNLQFELKHKAIIDRFGRYPHRNKIQGRECTEEELDFLQQPGSSFCAWTNY